MVGQSRKWMILAASVWIQAFTGTNLDFSSYSSDLKSVLGISQVQLNNLSMASDMGKAFGWCSGVCLKYLPLWVVIFLAAFMGFLGFGLQWLVIQGHISLPYSLEWAQRTENSSIELQGTSFNSVDLGDLDIRQKLVEIEASSSPLIRSSGNAYDPEENRSCCDQKFFKDRLSVLGEEHSVRLLIHRLDFWLYYLAYFCGGTIGIVYGNNLGQIAQSLGYGSEISSFVSLYSACSFFGRLLSAIPDLLGDNMYYPRTGWLVLGLVPTPIAFLLLVSSGSQTALRTATAFIGLSSGFIVTAAVSMTAELFGPVSTGVNHNILITNIPLGSLLYGLLAALLYQRNIRSSNLLVLMDGSTVCIGRQCYSETFAWWSFISMFGVASGYLLFLRTRAVYSLERNRNWMQYP